MTRTVSAAIGVLFVLATTSTAWAKGITVMVVVEGSGLGEPIYIRDPTIEQFHVWAGPGTRMNGIEGREGFIIDWSTTVAPDQARSLQRYQLSFYVKQWNSVSRTYSGEHLAYVVSYVVDSLSGESYVYLPGGRDAEYRLNARSIHRGPRWEGHWFRATPAWRQLVTPLLEAAQFRR